MTSSRKAHRDLPWAARTLAIDAFTASITRELEEGGVPTIVLKGPAVADWLYRRGEVRAYGDTDLLISPRDWEKAMVILRGLGFEDDLESLAHPRMESTTSYPWVRGDYHVDLHATLWGIEVDPARVWEVLSDRTVPIKVGGRYVVALAPEPRAMHVALHAAQHGPDARKPLRDLEQAVSLLPMEVWEEAADLAVKLQAIGALATGLRLIPAGAELAERLGIADRNSVDALMRASWVPLAEGFQELATTPGITSKLALLRSELVPSRNFILWWSPLARRGKLGLAAAYLWRPLWIAFRAGPGFLAWRRARRRAAAR